MGNSSDKIGLLIEVNNDVVFPGETVSGIVYISVRSPTKNAILNLGFKGTENTFLELGQHSPKESSVICDYQQTIARWEELEIGDFSAPFTVTLPNRLLGSIDHRKSQSVWIEYFVEARIMNEHNNELIAGCQRQIAVKQICDISGYSVHHLGPVVEKLKTCCSDNGFCSFHAHLDKTVFYLDDTIHLAVHIDATNCLTDLQEVSVSLKKKIQIKARLEVKKNTITLVSMQLPKVTAGTSVMLPVSLPITVFKPLTTYPLFPMEGRLSKCVMYVLVRIRKKSCLRSTQRLKFNVCVLPRYDGIEVVVPPPPIPIGWQPAQLEGVELIVPENSEIPE